MNRLFLFLVFLLPFSLAANNIQVSNITLNNVKLISNVDPLDSQIFLKQDAKMTILGEV